MKIALTTFAVVLTFTVSATAQRKKTTKKTTTPTTNVATSTLETKQGAEKVSIQVKNVSRFLYILGGVATGFEVADGEAKEGKLSKAVIDKNNQGKQAVITSIRNMKAGLAALEVEFRTKPALQKYLLQIQGITDMTTRSEDLATAGRFNDSGKNLLLVVEKLTDTLAAMP